MCQARATPSRIMLTARVAPEERIIPPPAVTFHPGCRQGCSAMQSTRDKAVQTFISIIDRLILRIETNPPGEPWDGTVDDESELKSACDELGIKTPPLSKDHGDGSVLWLMVEPKVSSYTISTRQKKPGAVWKEKTIARGVTAHPILHVSQDSKLVTDSDADGSVRRRALQTLKLWRHAAETGTPPFTESPKTRQHRGPKPATPSLQTAERAVFKRWTEYRDDIRPHKKDFLNRDRKWIESKLKRGEGEDFTYPDLCRLIDRVCKRIKRTGESN